MEKIKYFCAGILYLGRQICLLPQTLARSFKARGEQSIRNDREAERLDRIRNPSKYLGK
jgi:hypothetical protein